MSTKEDSYIPIVSIIMAFHNEANYLTKSIESICNQTFKDWELVLVDDGSSDQSLRIANEYAARMSNIVCISTGVNIGLPSALNIAICKARGKYIARADADDISLPERIEKQVKYMEVNPDIDILGTGAFLINSSGERVCSKTLKENHFEISSQHYRSTIFFHPSVVIRKCFFKYTGFYDAKLLRSQDKELWLRGIKAGAKYHNLQECLIEYRTNNYKKSINTLFQKLRANLLIVKRYNVRYGKIYSIISFLRSILINLGLYKP